MEYKFRSRKSVRLTSKIAYDIDLDLDFFVAKKKNFQVLQKKLLYFCNLFSLFEAQIDIKEKKTDCFLIEINCSSALLSTKKARTVFEWMDNDDSERKNCLKRLGYFFEDEQSILSVFYDKEDVEYFPLIERNDNEKLFYLFSLCDIMKNSSTKNERGSGILHPNLLFRNSEKKLLTVDDFFWSFKVTLLLQNQPDIDILKYYFGFLIDEELHFDINSMSEIRAKLQETDVLSICVLFKYISNCERMSYESICTDLSDWLNSEKEEDEKGISKPIVSEIIQKSSDRISVKSITEFEDELEKFIKSRIIKDEQLTCRDFLCLECGEIKVEGHRCERKENRRSRVSKDEYEEILHEIDLLPQLKINSLYPTLDKIDQGINEQVKNESIDIFLIINKEQKKLNDLIDYINDLLKKTKDRYTESLSSKCTETKEKIAAIIGTFEKFYVRFKNEKKESFVSKASKDIEDFDTALQENLEELRISAEELENFFYQSQSTLSHLDFDSRLEDQMRELRKEYNNLVSFTSKYFNEYLDISNKHNRTLISYLKAFNK